MGFINDAFGSLLKGLYDLTQSYGVAIILFTFVTRIIFIYFAAKAKKSSLKMQRMIPRQKEIEAKFKNDRMKSQQAIQQMYQQEGINPMSGCLWSLIPLPIMMILYAILRAPLTYMMKLGDQAVELGGNLKTWVETGIINAGNIDVSKFGTAAQDQLSMVKVLTANGDVIADKLQAAGDSMAHAGTVLYNGGTELAFNYKFLGLNLFDTPSQVGFFSLLIIIPLLAAGLTFLSTYLTQKWSGAQTAANMKFMFFLFPVMTFFFGYTLPAGIGLYWIAGSVYAIVQDYYMTKHYRKVLDAEDAKRAEFEAKKKAAEQAMKEELRQRRAEEYASGERKKPKQYKLKNQPQQKKRENLPSGDTDVID